MSGAALLRGSYHPDEVSFLLTDLSGHSLELDLHVREKAIQNGRNYAEMLPIEFAPSAAYLAPFDTLLERFSAQIAEHVGVLTELAMAARRNALWGGGNEGGALLGPVNSPAGRSRSDGSALAA